MAGYRELLAVEWDKHAVETFKLNFPDVPVWHGDIAKLSVEECLKITGLKPGELDVLDGSPPCQGLSTAEFKRFGSFPDDFVFAGEFEEGIKQIGNCVPPLFMKAIAENIRSGLFL